MPLADRKEIHRLICSRRPGLVGKAALVDSEWIVNDHVRARYTQFESLDFRGDKGPEAIAEARQEVQEILASWRGRD